MKLTIDSHKYIPSTVDKEIEFPYYAWWCSHKDRMIKLDLVYDDYNLDRLLSVKVITLSRGFTIPSRMERDRIRVNQHNVVDSKLLPYLVDYDQLATEEEFLKFRQEIIDDII